MRRNVLRLAVVASSAAVTVSCSTDQLGGVSSPTDLRLAREDDIKARRVKAAKIGHFHNRLLEFVKDDVTGRSRARKYSFSEEMALAAASCTRFMKSEGVNYTCVFSRERKNISTQIVLGPSIARPRSDLSEAAIDYLAQIEVAAAAATGASGFATASSAIAAAAEGELYGDDLDAVLGAVALGDSSFTYWETRGNTFVTSYVNNRGLEEPYTMMVDPISGHRIAATVILARPTLIRYGWFQWKSVANWDISGCVVATIFTGGGCALGGGAASAGEAIYQILQHYT